MVDKYTRFIAPAILTVTLNTVVDDDVDDDITITHTHHFNNATHTTPYYIHIPPFYRR